MASVARYLADTSALARLHLPPVAAVLSPLIEAGLVATCGVIEFELVWATRSANEFDRLRHDRHAGYEWLATVDEDWSRALTVQQALWRCGQMRAVGFPDLLVAAVAEREHVTVVHYDADYALIADDMGGLKRVSVRPDAPVGSADGRTLATQERAGVPPVRARGRSTDAPRIRTGDDRRSGRPGGALIRPVRRCPAPTTGRAGR